jgi:hypothetical protein
MYVAKFRSASTRWRAGELAIEFPVGAVRPFLWPPLWVTAAASAASL